MKKLFKQSFLYSFAATAWIALVAIFMQNANNWFGKQDTIVTSITVLLLFSTSALVVGGLLAGKPIFLYIDGQKKDAVKMVVANAGWMILFLLIAVVVLATTK